MPDVGIQFEIINLDLQGILFGGPLKKDLRSPRFYGKVIRSIFGVEVPVVKLDIIQEKSWRLSSHSHRTVIGVIGSIEGRTRRNA